MTDARDAAAKPSPGQPRSGVHDQSVLFLHGYACSARDWGATVASLANDYNCCAVDFPGHGSSQQPAPQTFAELVAFLEVLIQREYAQPPVIVGHSMGGMTAMALAAQEPDMVRAVVLADAFPHLPTAAHVLGAAEDPCDPFGYGSVLDRQTPEVVQRHVRRSMASGAQRAGAALFDSLLAVDLRPQIPALTCPTLLVLGDRRWITEQHLTAVLNDLGYAGPPQLQTQLVASHHFVMLEQPTDVNDVLRAFIDQCDPSLRPVATTGRTPGTTRERDLP